MDFTIIRDLLTKPQRFSDLLQYSSNITPKWLTLTLRQLEEAGIVEHEEQPGRREVWYRLTSAGEDLRPVVEAMKDWGLKHAMRPPLQGEVVRPDLTMSILTDSLNKRGRNLPYPAIWLMYFTHGGTQVLFFDGDRWSTRPGEEVNPDVRVTVSPERGRHSLPLNGVNEISLFNLCNSLAPPNVSRSFYGLISLLSVQIIIALSTM